MRQYNDIYSFWKKHFLLFKVCLPFILLAYPFLWLLAHLLEGLPQMWKDWKDEMSSLKIKKPQK